MSIKSYCGTLSPAPALSLLSSLRSQDRKRHFFSKRALFARFQPFFSETAFSSQRGKFKIKRRHLQKTHKHCISGHKKTRQILSVGSHSLGYKDSNLEMTESESVVCMLFLPDFMRFLQCLCWKLTYRLTYQLKFHLRLFCHCSIVLIALEIESLRITAVG